MYLSCLFILFFGGVNGEGKGRGMRMRKVERLSLLVFCFVSGALLNVALRVYLDVSLRCRVFIVDVVVCMHYRCVGSLGG